MITAGMLKQINSELDPLKEVLAGLRQEGKVLVALLFGSYAGGAPHVRSDIDLAVYIKAGDEEERLGIIDAILMSVDREVNILSLEDEDESQFVVQEALRGIHLVEPDAEALYSIARRALHETEGISFRRSLVGR